MEATNESAAVAVVPQSSTQVALPAVDRARQALDVQARETHFLQLVATAKSITTITNPDGYKDCHSARMAMKNARIDLTKDAKTARDDATAFNKAVIAEEKRLIALTDPEETRLQELQTEYDERAEREKREAEEREAARKQAITNAIAELFKAGAFQSDEKSTALSKRLAALSARVLDIETFGERIDEARTVFAGALAQLREARNAAVAREQEAIETANKLAEFETLKAQNAALLKEKHEREAADAARDLANAVADNIAACWAEAHADNAQFDAERRAVLEQRERDFQAAADEPAYRDETHTNPSTESPAASRKAFEEAMIAGEPEIAARACALFPSPSDHLKAMERVNALRNQQRAAAPAADIPSQATTPAQAAALRARWKAAAATSTSEALRAIVTMIDTRHANLFTEDMQARDFSETLEDVRDICAGTLIRHGYNEAEFF